MPLLSPTACRTVADNLDHPEGVAFGPDGNPYTGGEAGQVFRIRSDGSAVVEYANTGGGIGGIALAAAGNLYVACYAPDAISVVAPDRSIEVVIADDRAMVINRPTNVAFGPQDTDLYFANLGDFHIGAVSAGERGAPLHYPELPCKSLPSSRSRSAFPIAIAR